MEEVKKPASAQTDSKNQKQPKLSTPLFLLLCHLICIVLFILCYLADWALGDTESQNITSVAVFFLPVLVAAAIILWDLKLPDNARLSSPAFMVACFFTIGVVWILIYLRIFDVFHPVASDAASATMPSSYSNDMALSIFVFGIIYTLTDTVLMTIYFIFRWILSMIRENKPAKESPKQKKKK